MNRYLCLLLLACLSSWAAQFPDTSTDQQVIVNSNNVSAGSTSFRWSFTDNRVTVGPTGTGSRMTMEGAAPSFRLYAGGNPASSYSRMEFIWDSGTQQYYLRENVSGSNAIPFVVGINLGATLTFNTDGSALHSGALGLSAATNRLSIVNNTLYLDGSPAIPTAAAPVNNFYATNIYSQNGAHNTMNISNYLTVSGQYVYPLVAGTGITFATNTISAGKTNLTISSAGGSTAVTTLTYSGTNIVGADMATNGMSFYLLVTNHCLLGTATFSNLPAKTAYQTYTFCFQQDSAGGYVPKLTNSIWGWADGNQPVIKTNANAVSYIYAHTGLATNSTLVGTPNINIQ